MNYTQDYTHYFELLQDAIDNGIFRKEKKKVKKVNKNCCRKMKIVEDNTYKICINCGYSWMNNIEYGDPTYFLNPKYQLSTEMGNSYYSKYRSLKRLHTWNNYDYRENAANVCYDEIKKIGKSIKLSDKIINQSCFLYKVIYIDNKVSSRNKIKRSIYCYCLHRSSCHNETDINIIELLKDNDLTIENYNKALGKVKDKEKLYLNINIEKYYHLLIFNYKVTISINDFIIQYNRIVRISKRNRFKLNFNSLLLATIYYIIDNTEEDYRFYEIFNTTYITLSKFKKLLKLL